MQIKVTMRYHYILMRVAKIKDRQYQVRAGMYSSCTTHTLLVQSLWKTVEKINIYLSLDPVMSLLKAYPMEMETRL